MDIDPTPEDAKGFWEFLDAKRDEAVEKYEVISRSSGYSANLVDAFAEYQRVEQFVPGQLVQWKPQMRNQRFPAYGTPAVVVHYFPEAWTVDLDGERAVEPLDFALGFVDGDNDFRVFPFSSARFMAWEEPG